MSGARRRQGGEGCGGFLVKSEDIARAAGVSRAVVSQILNGRGQRFLPETRERVERIARELGYQPSFAGRALAMGRSDAVVALVPDTTFGGHLQDVIQGATAELGDAGLTLLTYFEGSGADGLERLISVVRPAAVLPLGNVDPELAQLIDRNPGVVLAHVPGAVGKDGELIGALQAEHLIERGYRQLRFAAFLDRRSDLYGDGRMTGFERVCRAHGIEPLPAWSLTVSGEMAAECASQVGDESVGIGCYNDEIAMTLMGAMLRRRLTVPGRVGMIGVDHTALGQAIPTPLTTIAYDPWQRGQDLGRFALEAIGRPASPRSTDRPYSVVQGSTT